ncbi:MAG: alpha/beta hydrolase [Tardiphaga sp.]|nr:alpha/beta hydrolase [Tardiphaga sp.]
MKGPPEPTDWFYESQGLRLHVTDWGNAAAPPLILLHGGRDHSRSWDLIARALQPHFHVMAPDLRGHGDSEWAKGSSYTLSDHIYDLTPLASAGRETVLVGHSFGGMISLAFAGTFPERVSRLVALDGAFLPSPSSAPIDAQMAEWIAQLDSISRSKVRRFRDVTEAAERMSVHNKRLTAEQALHLARHAVRPNADGTFSWKYDPYQRAQAPYRLSRDDYTTLWSRIACPVLLFSASESFIPDSAKAGRLRHFKQVEHQIVAGAGHWLHHDEPEEVLAALRSFLGIPD